ncbi:MAG: aminotransferase class I/II-fold pyridoxal phosphate-dependent enzyme [Verrucomicrobia bacterium]|nr:aminotransferase class I/II-fold pyridoxal phosphate-dependent enzyme [Verrucomicrobiota bacterium]
MKIPKPQRTARRRPRVTGLRTPLPPLQDRPGRPEQPAQPQASGTEQSEQIVISGCDYLGLSDDAVIREAWLNASASGPLQTGASRATTGDHPLYRRAEKAIADFLNEPAAVLTATGYLASLAVAQGLRDQATHVVVDASAHNCVQDGARLSGLPILSFASGDARALRSVLRELPPSARPLVATDGVYGIRGGMAPLNEYLLALPASGWLWVDDAHGLGSVGPTGRGSPEFFGLRDSRLIRSVTFSKALAVAGGAVIGDASLMEHVRTRAGAYLGSSAPPLAIAAAITAAVVRVHRLPGRVRRLQELARRFSNALPSRPEILNDPRTPVTAIHPRDAAQAQRLTEALTQAGFVPPWICYPGGPGGGFFRIALKATHSRSQIDRLARTIRTGLNA